jgi:uncharacterized protein
MASTIPDIRSYAQECFSNAPGSHSWDHTRRVHRLCRHIGSIEGADIEVLEIAAFLHDVGRPSQDRSKGAICHAERGGEMARDVLQHASLSPEKKANIIHCIRSHRFRGNHIPETIEAKVLFDSDKLDAIGAVGIGRAFLFAGEVGAKLHNPEALPEKTAPYTEEDTAYREYRLKLFHIKDRLLTGEGRRMARERHAFMESFFERFLEEYEGRK